MPRPLAIEEVLCARGSFPSGLFTETAASVRASSRAHRERSYRGSAGHKNHDLAQL